MPRKSIPSTTLAATVRRYFGLQQHELAGYLGVSPELVKHIEAGRRALTAQVLLRLNPLAAQVPAAPPPPLPEEELTATAAPPDPAPLEARRDYCVWKAAKLRRELGAYAQKANAAHRWRQALPALLAQLPPADSTSGPAPNDPAAAELWQRARRVRHWLQQRPTELSPTESAEWHLLRLRAAALEAEAAALTELLA